MITFQDFQKVELKAGKIEAAEAIPGADKLLKLQVNIGEETPRTIVAGIAQVYTTEELVGKMVAIVANLEPTVLRGVRSDGMLLAAWDKSDIKSLSLVTFDRAAEPGMSIT